VLFLRPEQPISKTGREKSGPKAIAWPRKVVSGPGGIQAWVYSAKKHLQIVGNDIRNPPVRGRKQFRFGSRFLSCSFRFVLIDVVMFSTVREVFPVPNDSKCAHHHR
jgi:hypothetical protein